MAQSYDNVCHSVRIELLLLLLLVDARATCLIFKLLNTLLYASACNDASPQLIPVTARSKASVCGFESRWGHGGLCCVLQRNKWHGDRGCEGTQWIELTESKKESTNKKIPREAWMFLCLV